MVVVAVRRAATVGTLRGARCCCTTDAGGVLLSLPARKRKRCPTTTQRSTVPTRRRMAAARDGSRRASRKRIARWEHTMLSATPCYWPLSGGRVGKRRRAGSPCVCARVARVTVDATVWKLTVGDSDVRVASVCYGMC